MKSNFQKVKEFHTKMDLTITQNPTLPGAKEEALRVRLITEEWRELRHEMQITHNIEHIAKELTDLVYVILGTAATYGIDFDLVFDEVHRSNMTKLDKNGNPVKREDGKIIKSKEYEPANMSKIMEIMNKESKVK